MTLFADQPRGRRNRDTAGSVFHIYKLHGSVNWSRKAENAIEVEPKPTPRISLPDLPSKGKYQQTPTFSRILSWCRSISPYCASPTPASLLRLRIQRRPLCPNRSSQRCEQTRICALSSSIHQPMISLLVPRRTISIGRRCLAWPSKARTFFD